ncbi:MAG: MmcQ/YjbR family DNA-binding protein [Phycicoccus sp.]
MDRHELDALAMALPEVVRGGSDERPDYSVRGKVFLKFRRERRDAVDPDTGELLPDVIVVAVSSLEEKLAVLQLGPPWFTTPHFDGYDYVLVRERDLGLLDEEELAEIVADAWAAHAPKRLVEEHLS